MKDQETATDAPSDKEDKGDEERKERLSRRSKEERDAKKASARGGSRFSGSQPGASHETSDDRRSRRKAERSSSGHTQSVRKNRRSTAETEAKRNSRAASGVPPSPGASIDGISDASESVRTDRLSRRSERELKAKQRNKSSSRNIRPGAERASSPRRSSRSYHHRSPRTPGSREYQKSRREADGRQARRKDEILETVGSPGLNDDLLECEIDGPVEIQAESVADEEERVKKLEERNQLLEGQMQQIIENPNANNVDGALQQHGGTAVMERDKNGSNHKKRNFIILFVLLVAGAGGIAGYFLSQTSDSPAPIVSSDSRDPDTIVPPVNPVITTNVPTIPVTTIAPTEPPTVRLYDPPSEEDCLAIQSKTEVNGQGDMLIRSFDLGFDVSLFEETPVNAWEDQVLAGIEDYLVPTLAGCPNVGRRLHGVNPSFLRAGVRHLLANRYSVGNVIASMRESDEDEKSCEAGAQEPCSRVLVTMELFLKGDEKILDLINLIIEVVGAGVPSGLAEVFGLDPEVFRSVFIGTISSIDPTSAPSTDPSMMPTISPSTIPSLIPSAPAPTEPPTVNPTPASIQPTVSPTPAPTAFQHQIRFRIQHQHQHQAHHQLRPQTLRLRQPQILRLHQPQLQLRLQRRYPHLHQFQDSLQLQLQLQLQLPHHPRLYRQPQCLPRFQPMSLPRFQPMSLPRFQPMSLPRFQPMSLPRFQPIIQRMSIPKYQLYRLKHPCCKLAVFASIVVNVCPIVALGTLWKAKHASFSTRPIIVHLVNNLLLFPLGPLVVLTRHHLLARTQV